MADNNRTLAEIESPLRVDDTRLAARIGEELLRLGYIGPAMREAVPETAEASTTLAMDHAAVAARLSTETPLACLMRAFQLGEATAEAVMKHALGEELFGLCDRAGLWTRVDGGVVGTVTIHEDEGRFLLSDHLRLSRSEIELHWVMSAGSSSMVVANSVAGRPFPRVLDLCCGGGIQSFHVAARAERVVAVDKNQRALNLGRFGAAMNGHGNIEFGVSDCYEAVEGEEFDLIVCNPPYVMTPDRQSYYRDGGMGGDRFAEKILRAAPLYLADGGFAHFTCDVGTMGGRAGSDRLKEWLSGNGCDAVVLGGLTAGAAEYARSWLAVDSHDRAKEELRRWITHFSELGVEEIQNWLVVLRRRGEGGPNWYLQDALPATRRGHFGHQIARMFACQDVLRMNAAAMWQARLQLAPDMRLVQGLRPEGGRWIADSAKLTFDAGLIQEFDVEPRTAGALILFDGTRTAEEILFRMAEDIEQNPGEIREGWLRYMRHLVGSGLLEPAD